MYWGAPSGEKRDFIGGIFVHLLKYGWFMVHITGYRGAGLKAGIGSIYFFVLHIIAIVYYCALISPTIGTGLS